MVNGTDPSEIFSLTFSREKSSFKCVHTLIRYVHFTIYFMFYVHNNIIDRNQAGSVLT